ncbi:MAG: radical SAM protein [Chloroflexi bacterium]|nr:radical SAM protein [Chloroflexota bacterium]
MVTSPHPPSERGEILWEYTRSLCPTCKQVIDGQVYLRDGKVYLRKRCPQHGPFEALIFGDAGLYTDIARFNKPGTLPRRHATEVREGCPYDCGLCTDHQQHACLGVIEVNNLCNLDCPLCFANAGTKHRHEHSGYELTHEQVNFMLDTFIASENNPEVLQFSGGEPTLHPQILDFIALAQRKGISYVMLNTNGIRIARDDEFLAGIAKLKPHIYLQFDGFEPQTNRLLRGKSDLLDEKLRALERLAEADVRVVLVAVIERGVNEQEVGRILEFSLRHPAVFGISFHCAMRAQRHIPADPLTRLTIPDIVSSIETQSKGLFTLKDFVPVPCCMPVCHFVTYAMIQGDSVLPAPRVLPVEQYLDYLQNRSVPAINEDLRQILERLWSSSTQVGSEGLYLDLAAALGETSLENSRAAERCPSCHTHLPINQHTPRDLGRHIFMVGIRDFMDPWTFHMKNAMKCCLNFLTPDGRMIPFCAYNSVGYREQVTAELVGRTTLGRAIPEYPTLRPGLRS